MTSKLRAFDSVSGKGYHHFCPACGHAHTFYVSNNRPGGRPAWSFDGNMEKPTFSPSMRIFHPAYTDEDGKHPEQTVCHYFLRAGEIQFLGDCAHAMKDKTVPLPPFPADYNTGES